MPRREMLAGWAETVPPHFRFAVKASRRITHDGRLKAAEVAESVAYLYGNLEALGERRGPVLFQLPPNLKRDLPRLVDFLALLPRGHRAVFEFREPSWYDDAVYDALKSAGAALCLSEREDNAPPPLVRTADWGYLRLRLEQYADADLAAWARRIAETGWTETFAYFMHEPTAPPQVHSRPGQRRCPSRATSASAATCPRMSGPTCGAPCPGTRRASSG
jgi:uncharacterized protein YecE (DUF72 family)